MIIEELLYSDIIPYIAIFLAFFAVLFFLLNRSIFRENKGAGAVISICISLIGVWSIARHTDYIYSISDLFKDFQESTQLVIIIALFIGILFVLYKAFKKTINRADIKWSWFLIAGILILIKFLPNLISQYYLPGILEEESIGNIALVLGIIFGIIGIVKIRLLKISKRTSQGIIEYGKGD
jgi:hypothetical protein